MIEIIPAILEKEWEEVENKLNLIEGLTPYVQIDITDGVFAPETSWNNAEQLKFFLDNNRPNFFIEMDLMVENPEDCLRSWIEAGVQRLILHFESLKDLEYIFHYLENLELEIPDMQKIEIGFALDIETPLEKIYPWLDKITVVQLMGIAKIGYQGQPFDERVLKRIKTLRKKYPNIIISVDGGVNLESAPRLIKAGVNMLVSGSAVFKKGNLEENIQSLGSEASK